jgi:predicted AlkP superfamily phosphohydrolase/phosphomutase
MIRRLAIVVGCLAMAACSSGAPKASGGAERVVLISYDGLGADLLASWLADGTAAIPGGLRTQVDEGYSARRLRMANPTMTAVNHPVLATGAWPGRTGIVGSVMRVSGDSLDRWSSGFLVPPETPTLWEEARRAGHRVGTVLWPHVGGEEERLRADFGMAWPKERLAGPWILTFDPEDAHPEPELPVTDGLGARSWPFRLATGTEELVRGRVAVLDATPDGRDRYDTVAVRDADGAWRYVEDRGWFDLRATASIDGEPRAHLGWSKVLHLNRGTGGLRLYVGEFNRLWGYPESFRQRLEAAVGPWPGMPDGPALADWWLDAAEGIDLDTFMEQAERLDRYIDAATAWVLANEEAQLLLAYHPTPDAVQQHGLLVDRRQWGWSEGREFAAREALRRLGRSVDASVADLWKQLDPTRDAVVLVSDHGHVPVHDEVRIHQALAEAGLVTLTEDGRHVAADSPLRAACSGGAAHLYANVRGREPGGVVNPDDVPVLLRRATRALADLGVDGEPVVERIVSRPDLPAHHLNHDNAGDLVVFVHPGFTTSAAIGAPSSNRRGTTGITGTWHCTMRCAVCSPPGARDCAGAGPMSSPRPASRRSSASCSASI